MSVAEDKIVSNLPAEAPFSSVPAGAGRASPLFGRLLKWAALLIVLILALDAAASVLVGRASVHHRLDARLAAAFGRPVEVESYSFSLWGGPTLGASGVTAVEDPRFGYEYFLRADSLAVRLRWSSLLRGRVELGTVSLAGPTLNVEQNAAGEWNLAEWLGHPIAAGQGAVRPQQVPFVPRLRQIQVDGGRVNFKRGDEKLPFAFVNVAGTINSDGGERWQVDLETSPWRAATILQQAGTIHLSGNIGGTSSALRPATLQMSWSDASVSDFLRLIRGDDRGVRGAFALALNADLGSDNWSLEGRAQLAGLHRWDLAERADNPAVTVTAKIALDLVGSKLQITEAALETPHSNAQAHGAIDWGNGGKPAPKTRAKGAPAATPADVEITAASVDMGDLLAWLRAFRSGIPDTLAVQGTLESFGNLSGWPPSVTDAMVTSSGADLSGGGMRAPIRVGQLQLSYVAGPAGQHALAMTPATVTIEAPPIQSPGRRAASEDAPEAGSFRVEIVPAAKAPGRAAAQAGMHIAGGSADASALIAAANAFGWDVSRGWNVSGPLHGDVRWPPMPSTEQRSGPWPWQTKPVGSVTLGGAGNDAATLRAPFLNLPVSGLQARIDWTQGSRHVAVSLAQAFGTHWTGTLDRGDFDSQWTVALASPHLDAADLDRWLNPRWRESLLDRVLPFLNSPSDPTAAAENIRAAGRLSVDEFVAQPFTIERLQGAVKIDGRHVSLENAIGQLSGGKLSGSMDAQLEAVPAYSVRASFSGANLVPASKVPLSDARFSGVASGQVDLSMQGASRQDLFGSLRCNGSLDVRDAAWRGVSLSESLAGAMLVAGNSAFRDASADFTCGNQALALKNIALSTASGRIAGSGNVDFSRNLNLQFRVAPQTSASQTATSAPPATGSVLMTGTPDAPQFTPALAPRRGR
jgi:uncharacterized protein involved in outer membrane biogenesis